MSEKEPKIYQEQPKGKLTPEEVKEMVKKYKKEHEGLLPEYFSLPGEEKEEKREYSEETLLAHEIKEFLEKIRPEIENRNLIKNRLDENAERYLNQYIESGQWPGDTKPAWTAVCGYTLFKQSGLWSKLNQESRNLIEESIKSSQLIKNAKKELRFEIEDGQKSGGTEDAWNAVYGYTLFKQSGLWSKLDQKFRDWVEENIKDSQLIKNAEEEVKSYIGPGHNSNETEVSWWVIRGYTFFKQSGLWSKLDQEFKNLIEKNIKNPQLIQNAEEYLRVNIETGQRPGELFDAWEVVWGYVFFSQFQKILEEEGRRKEIAKATEKAMHPEKKLPPIPEEKAF